MKKYLSLAVVGLLAMTWQADVCAKTYIRYEAHSEGGQKALASMKIAMDKLKAVGCSEPASWYFQGAMHWTPDAAQPSLKENPLCLTFNNANPKPLDVTWKNCASHEKGAASLIHFLSWHRLYLVHFEQIIRELSGDASFALPYWDYSQQFTLPSAFQDTSGSLYQVSRNSSLNANTPIDSNTQGTISSDMDTLFTPPILDYATFNSTLNSGLHGFMHVYIGGTPSTGSPPKAFNEVENKNTIHGMMSSIPDAAFDPIFWLHHSNVDRLWQKFISTQGSQNVTLDQLNSVTWQYEFFQPIHAQSGEVTYKRINYTMPEVYAAINSVDYTYDDTPVVTASLEAKAKPSVLNESTLVSVKPNNIHAALNSLAKLRINLPTTLKALATTGANKTRTILELNVSYQKNHEGRYDVFINLPDTIKADSKEARKYFAGAISFFVNDPQEEGGSGTFRYDITSKLSANDKKDLAISVIKTYGPEEGVITLDKATVKTLK